MPLDQAIAPRAIAGLAGGIYQDEAGNEMARGRKMGVAQGGFANPRSMQMAG